jgi:hypothetical protein
VSLLLLPVLLPGHPWGLPLVIAGLRRTGGARVRLVLARRGTARRRGRAPRGPGARARSRLAAARSPPATSSRPLHGPGAATRGNAKGSRRTLAPRACNCPGFGLDFQLGLAQDVPVQIPEQRLDLSTTLLQVARRLAEHAAQLSGLRGRPHRAFCRRSKSYQKAERVPPCSAEILGDKADVPPRAHSGSRLPAKLPLVRRKGGEREGAHDDALHAPVNEVSLRAPPRRKAFNPTEARCTPENQRRRRSRSSRTQPCSPGQRMPRGHDPSDHRQSTPDRARTTNAQAANASRACHVQLRRAQPDRREVLLEILPISRADPRAPLPGCRLGHPFKANHLLLSGKSLARPPLQTHLPEWTEQQRGASLDEEPRAPHGCAAASRKTECPPSSASPAAPGTGQIHSESARHDRAENPRGCNVFSHLPHRRSQLAAASSQCWGCWHGPPDTEGSLRLLERPSGAMPRHARRRRTRSVPRP